MRRHFGLFCSVCTTLGVILCVADAHAEALPFAWGWNAYGQLGDGTTTDRLTPVQVMGLGGVTAIAAGGNHSLALKNDGTVWACGWNSYGQLGDGTTSDRWTPVQVTGLTGVAAIAGQSTHSLALKNDGTVWAWGDNSYGKLGDGTNTNSSTPVQVTGLSGVTAIATMIGSQHSLALKNDGTVWAWGYNGDGRLGDGTTTGSWTPVQVTGLSGVTAVAGGGSHSLALKNDGTVWAWGGNAFGELGDGTTTDRSTPVQATGLSGVTAIAGGYSHSLALKNDGTVWAWGNNTYGEVGDGTTTQRNTPVQATGLSGVTAIAGGNWHNLALRNDGTVWSWGRNTAGQLGDGTTTDRYTPVQVAGLSGVGAIAGGGYYHSLALVGPPAITSATSANGTVGTAFSYTITATNTPTSYGATNLPGGLSVDAAGAITGTPTAAGVTDVTISATNASGTGSATLQITISSQAPSINSLLTATGTVGQSFSYEITASGTTPITYSAAPLPAGLSLSGASISGTPSTEGVTDVTLGANNASGSDSKVLKITIHPSGAPAITSLLTATGQVGTVFTYQITALGDAPITFNATDLPAWASFSTDTISGTPPATGTASVTISATNTSGTDTKTLEITINAAGAPSITSALTAKVQAGTAFTYEIKATGTGTITFGTGTLPGWLTFDGTATLTGTPQAGDVGTVKITLTAANASGTDTKELQITVSPANGDPPVVTDIYRSRNPVRTNTPVTFVAEGVAPSGQPLSYRWYFFDSAGKQAGAPQAGKTVTFSFPLEDNYTVVAVGNDGFRDSTNFTKVSVTLEPNSGSDAANVTVGVNVVNPNGGLGINVPDSKGGVVDLDLVDVAVGGDRADETFTTRIPTLPDSYDGRALAGKFSLSRVFVVETTGTKIGGETRKARIMVPISTPETGNVTSVVDQRANKGLAKFDMKGKFNFGKRADGVTLKTEIELPAGVSPSLGMPISVGIGNVTGNGMVDARGRVTGVSGGNVKKVQVKWPRLAKDVTATVGGEKAKVTVTLYGSGLDAAGFDTEGIVNKGLTDKQAVARQIQTAIVLGGVSYYAQSQVNYTLSRGTGMLQGRTPR